MEKHETATVPKQNGLHRRGKSFYGEKLIAFEEKERSRRQDQQSGNQVNVEHAPGIILAPEPEARRKRGGNCQDEKNQGPKICDILPHVPGNIFSWLSPQGFIEKRIDCTGVHGAMTFLRCYQLPYNFHSMILQAVNGCYRIT